MVLATTAIAMPSHGPKRRPDAKVNAVRGNGNTVTTMWAARKASGNHGPSDVAQSRSWVAPGRGTSNRSATRITIVAVIAASWRRGTCVAVQITAARSAARVLTTDFTAINTTGRSALGRYSSFSLMDVQESGLRESRERWRSAVAGVLAKSTRRDQADLPQEPER